jgi:hypothetical protein
MDDSEWFDFDGQLTGDERAFLAALRQRTEGPLGRWPAWCRRCPDYPSERIRDDGPLIVALHVDAPRLALLTIGAHLEDGRIRGDRMDHQSNELPERPTSLALDVTGPPADLAAHTADWLDSILRRPIVRHEWLHSGQVYASEHLFADNGEAVTGLNYSKVLAPPGQWDQLKRWITGRRLGKPDRVIPIRGGARPPLHGCCRTAKIEGNVSGDFVARWVWHPPLKR